VWGAIDPLTQWLLTIDAGDRTLAMAQRVVHHKPRHDFLSAGAE
jgi:hypothetical protein